MSRYAELVLAKGILGGRLKKIFLVVFCAACVQIRWSTPSDFAPRVAD